MKHPVTSKQQIDVLEQRAKLSRAVAKFRVLQATYTPTALTSLARRPAPSSNEPEPIEDVALYLPSAMSLVERNTGCHPDLVDVELRLRNAQCGSSLDSLRNQLHMKSGLVIYKEGNVRHQGPNTRARALLERNEAKIGLHAERYRAAWRARLLLGGPVLSEWRLLRAGDVLMQDNEQVEDEREERHQKKVRRAGAGDLLLPGEGRRVPSWLWMSYSSDNAAIMARKWIFCCIPHLSHTDVSVDIRVEWCKARARFHRWKEEVLILREEMRRTLVSFEYEASAWDARRDVSRDVSHSVALENGLRAYAAEHSTMYRQLIAHFETAWHGIHNATADAGPSVLADINSNDDDDDDDDDEAEKDGEPEEDIVDITTAEREDHYHVDD